MRRRASSCPQLLEALGEGREGLCGKGREGERRKGEGRKGEGRGCLGRERAGGEGRKGGGEEVKVSIYKKINLPLVSNYN